MKIVLFYVQMILCVPLYGQDNIISCNLFFHEKNLFNSKNYLDLTFVIDSGGKLSTRLYDKCDDFDFHIVNFPYLSSNLPSGPSYGVYISQLIRYARCTMLLCSFHSSLDMHDAAKFSH